MKKPEMKNFEMSVRDTTTLMRKWDCHSSADAGKLSISLALAIVIMAAIVFYKIRLRRRYESAHRNVETRDVASFTDHGTHVELRRLRFFISSRATRGQRVEVVRQCLHPDV